MRFENVINNSDLILTEGALVERLKSEYNLSMDASINHAGLIYTAPEALETIYRQYIEIGKKYNLPIMIMTPTRRVNHVSLETSQFSDKQIIEDSCSFLNKIKSSYDEYSKKVLIGGLLGCRGDAYSGAKVLNINEAYTFHKQQTIQFKNQKVDYLFAGIMPEINEAIGLAKAMAETHLPFVISFIIRNDGCLLDGTLLSEAIRIIDEQVYPAPAFYMTNCIHPTNLIKALQVEKNFNSPQLKRFLGIQANTSALSPEELNSCGVLHQDNFDNIIDKMLVLQKNFNLKIFGGCCGTNDAFISRLTEKLLLDKID
jgi:S-methylmethionine-dependent homocysteine/selenocysteine methylase